MNRLVVIGSGGHARVVIDTIRMAGAFEIAGVLDDDARRHGNEIDGIPVLGLATIEMCQKLDAEWGFIAIGSNRPRRILDQRLRSHLSWGTAIHPSAVVASSVAVGAGTLVAAGAVIQPGAVLGTHVIVNTAATVDHDCQIGDYTHLAPGVHLAGNVRVGCGAFLGIGTVVIPECRLGCWCQTGAGTVVVRDLPSNVLARGVPARWTDAEA